MDAGTPQIYSEILTRLAAVRRKEDIAAAIRGAVITAGVVLSAILASLALEQALYLGVLLRTLLFWGIVLLGLGLAGWYVCRPLLRLARVLPGEADEATAGRVGAAFPHVKDRMVNVLQLFHERGRTAYYSAALIDASFDDLREAIQNLNFTSIVSFSGSRRAGRLLAGATVLAVLLFVVFPDPFFGSAYRLLHFQEAFAAPVPFELLVEPGDREVIRGENVKIVVRVHGAPQQQIVLATKPEGQVAFDEQPLISSSPGVFIRELEGVKTSMTYYAFSGSVRSDEYRLRVMDRPMVKLLRVRLEFPRYANLPARMLDDNIGDITALKGTTAFLSVETNKNLTSAVVRFSDSTSVRLQTSGSKAAGKFVLMKEGSYHFLLTDSAGTLNTDPVEYALRIVPDAFPTVSIISPGMDLDVAGETPLMLLIRISDDYGFTRLRLASRLVQSRYEKPPEQYTFTEIPIPPRTGIEGTVSFTWNLRDLHLVPEDVVSYYAEVFDNDDVSGPKSSISEMFTLRLPSLNEVFSDVDRGQETSLENMRKALEEAKEAKQSLDELQQDVKKNQQKVDWQDQKKAEDLAKKYQEIQKNMDEVKSAVDSMVDKMQKNQVLSKETLDRYQELQHLMEELSTPEFREAMKRLEDAMQQMNPDALKQAMQQLNFSEEGFRKSIERTMNLLKRIQIEQQLDEAAKRAEAMAKQQDELREKTENADRQDSAATSELAERQKDLRKDFDQLQQQLADLQKKMEDFPQEMPLDQMEHLADSLQQSRLGEQMDSIAQQMEQQQMQEASQSQRSAAQSMSSLSRQLQQMKQSMMENQQQQVMSEMRRTEQDLLDLSKRQEDQKNESHTLEQNSRRFPEQADAQMELMNDLGNLTNRLSGLSQKTFGVTPEMGKSIGDAMRQMDGAMQSLEQRNGTAAAQQQGGAMASLNEAAQMISSALEGMRQGGGQMGMAGFMQRLQQMTMLQQQINAGSREPGGMTPEQAARMGRLAGEQGMVRKSLDELRKEAAAAGQLSRMLGDLSSIAEEMREVQTDLAQGNVNPETLRKEDRIVSRLLDSQRSMTERDYEKNRKSQTGTNVARTGPGQLDLSTQEGKDQLRRDLLKALEEGYARDYQDLIRRYFESLEQQEKPQQ